MVRPNFEYPAVMHHRPVDIAVLVEHGREVVTDVGGMGFELEDLLHELAVLEEKALGYVKHGKRTTTP